MSFPNISYVYQFGLISQFAVCAQSKLQTCVDYVKRLTRLTVLYEIMNTQRFSFSFVGHMRSPFRPGDIIRR